MRKIILTTLLFYPILNLLAQSNSAIYYKEWKYFKSANPYDVNKSNPNTFKLVHSISDSVRLPTPINPRIMVVDGNGQGENRIYWVEAGTKNLFMGKYNQATPGDLGEIQLIDGNCTARYIAVEEGHFFWIDENEIGISIHKGHYDESAGKLVSDGKIAYEGKIEGLSCILANGSPVLIWVESSKIWQGREKNGKLEKDFDTPLRSGVSPKFFMADWTHEGGSLWTLYYTKENQPYLFRGDFAHKNFSGVNDDTAVIFNGVPSFLGNNGSYIRWEHRFVRNIAVNRGVVYFDRGAQSPFYMPGLSTFQLKFWNEKCAGLHDRQINEKWYIIQRDQSEKSKTSFVLSYTNDGYLRLDVKYPSSGRYLSIQPESNNSGASIIASNRFPVSEMQKWMIEPMSNGKYKILSKTTGMVMSVRLNYDWIEGPEKDLHMYKWLNGGDQNIDIIK